VRVVYDIEPLLERLLPEAAERFLAVALGPRFPRMGGDGRFRLSACGRFSGKICADLLSLARNHKMSAALVLAEEEVVRTLYFVKGAIVGAESNVYFERLGRILLKAQVVSAEDADALVAKEEAHGLEAAASLLPPDTARWGLEKRTWEIGCSLLFMPNAHYLLVDGEPVLGPLPLLDVRPMALAMEGLRRYDEWRNGETPAPADPSPAPVVRIAEPVDPDPARALIRELRRARAAPT
jgi:hypothetical protein